MKLFNDRPTRASLMRTLLLLLLLTTLNHAPAQATKKPPEPSVTIQAATISTHEELIPGLNPEQALIANVEPLTALTSLLFETGRIRVSNQTSLSTRFGTPAKIALQINDQGSAHRKVINLQRVLIIRTEIMEERGQIIYYGSINIEGRELDRATHRAHAVTLSRFTFRLGENEAVILLLPQVPKPSPGIKSTAALNQREYMIIRIKDVWNLPSTTA